MKYLLLITLISVSSFSYSQQVIIFDEEDVCFITETAESCNPTDKRKSKLVSVYTKADFQNPSKLDKVNLTTPPLEWGKKVNDNTSGALEFYQSAHAGFITNLTLSNLKPNFTYILTLNGNPELDGNELLPDPVPQLPEEKYYDFLTVQTDERGAYQAKLGVYLTKGKYHVRFYVKDKSDSKIVLYHDYFRFNVK